MKRRKTPLSRSLRPREISCCWHLPWSAGAEGTTDISGLNHQIQFPKSWLRLWAVVNASGARSEAQRSRLDLLPRLLDYFCIVRPFDVHKQKQQKKR